jgi:AcrR family transcriptional regulator
MLRLDWEVGLMESFSTELRRRKNVQEIKREIAWNTKELFAQKGYSATSMDDICSINNRSRGSIYYHFKSKEEIFLYLIKLNTQEWMDSWRKIEGKYKTATEKLYALADHYVDDLTNPLNHAINEFMTGQVVSQQILDEMLTLIEMPYTLYEQIIKEGIERGEFKPTNPESVKYVVIGLFNGLSTFYFTKELDELRRLYKDAVDLILQGIQK